MGTRLKNEEAYNKGYKDASEKASFYLYHLCAHPDVNLDAEELINHFKKYMKTNNNH